jgi:hypothetical protein
MGPSRSRLLFAGAFALVPIAVACNAIVGLDDYKRTECGAFPCPYDGGFDGPDGFVPDGGIDAAPDAPPGVGPTSWAEFRMPNYKDDAGVVGAPPPSIDYESNGTEIVTDKVAGLVWRRALVGGGGGSNLTLEQARTKCAEIQGGGATWRVPKRIELVTLLSYGQGAPFIDKANFSVPSVKVWTSSEVRPLTPGAQKYWTVDFGSGQLGQQAGDDVATVLCVKGK